MIGIIVAMALEREAIQQHLEDYKCVNYGRQNYYIGTISGRDVTQASIHAETRKLTAMASVVSKAKTLISSTISISVRRKSSCLE